MRGGQNRLPAKVKKLRGTLDKRTPESGLDLPACPVPAPPARLSADHRRVWRELAGQVDALGVFTAADLSAFKLLVQTVTLAETADDFMAATARVRLLQAASGLLAAFGLSPASRGRVAKAPVSTEDQAERDLFGRPGMRLVGPGK